MVTGTTPNGGGIWKHILHGNEHGLLRRNMDVLFQALHFLDFNISPKSLSQWRLQTLRQHYNLRHDLNYQGKMFVDSGGYTLMFDPELDLSAYGIEPEHLATGILDLQLQMGANRVASLDFPIPPGLALEEALRRQQLTLHAALATAERFAQTVDRRKRTQLYIPIHGLTPDNLEASVGELIQQLDARNLLDVVHGFALGSMVPRRKNGQFGEVLEFARAARASIPDGKALHVFGVTGGLMPHLMQTGVSSFDASGYVQNARVLVYIDPVTRRRLNWKNLPAYPCTCRICRGRNIEEDHAVMDGRITGTDIWKSAVYAAIALHNLEMDLQLLDDARIAVQQQQLDGFIDHLPSRFPGMKVPQTPKERQPTVQVKIHHRADYDVRRRRWTPTSGTRLLLVLPCAQEKPYTTSKSYKRVWNRLTKELGEKQLEQVDVVFLSGLYGPVPREHVTEPAVVTYDFLLHQRDAAGISTVADRLGDFLTQHAHHYQAVVAYVSQPAYRKVVGRLISTHPTLTLLPSQGRMGQLAFYTKVNMAELVMTLKQQLGDPTAGDAIEITQIACDFEQDPNVPDPFLPPLQPEYPPVHMGTDD